MMSQDLKYYFKFVLSELNKFSSDFVKLGPVIIDGRLEEFEEVHTVLLPKEYKELISVYNGISLFGDVIYGVFDDEMSENLAGVYCREHSLVRTPQFNYLVPFSPDGGGNFYCFDTRFLDGHVYSCPVIFWESNLEYTDEPEVVAGSFYEWVVEIFIGWTLKYWNYDGSKK